MVAGAVVDVLVVLVLVEFGLVELVEFVLVDVVLVEGGLGELVLEAATVALGRGTAGSASPAATCEQAPSASSATAIGGTRIGQGSRIRWRDAAL